MYKIMNPDKGMELVIVKSTLHGERPKWSRRGRRWKLLSAAVRYQRRHASLEGCVVTEAI